LTLLDKYSILMRLETDKDFKQIHAARMYNVSAAAISQLVKRKDRIKRDYEFGLNPASKRVSCMNSGMKALDETLMLFIIESRNLNPHGLTTRMIWDKAISIATDLQLLENNGQGPNLWKPNRGWWYRFTMRLRQTAIPGFNDTRRVGLGNDLSGPLHLPYDIHSNLTNSSGSKRKATSSANEEEPDWLDLEWMTENFYGTHNQTT
jgi:hypothetical protein